MFNIRKSIFETNSSSVHALNLDYSNEIDDYDKTINKNEIFDLPYEHYGIEHDTLKDKLILLINIVYQAVHVYDENNNRLYTNAKIMDQIFHDKYNYQVTSNTEDIEALKCIFKKLGIVDFTICEQDDSTKNDFKFDWSDDYEYYSNIEDLIVNFSYIVEDYCNSECCIAKEDVEFLQSDDVSLIDKIMLFLNLPLSVNIMYGEY